MVWHMQAILYLKMNFESPVTSDPAVRKAIAMGIDKDSFVSVLLNGYGYVATGAFPDTVDFGGLLGYAPIMPVNQFSCSDFVNRVGRIPAPIHSFKN